MGFPLPPLPWYTWLALIILGLLGGGMIGAMFTLVSVGIRSLLIAAWIGIKVLAIKLFDWRLSSFGTAHWAGRREIRRAGLFTEAGIALGSWKGRTLVEPKGGHIVLFGPPRSRK